MKPDVERKPQALVKLPSPVHLSGFEPLDIVTLDLR